MEVVLLKIGLLKAAKRKSLVPGLKLGVQKTEWRKQKQEDWVKKT